MLAAGGVVDMIFCCFFFFIYLYISSLFTLWGRLYDVESILLTLLRARVWRMPYPSSSVTRALVACVTMPIVPRCPL